MSKNTFSSVTLPLTKFKPYHCGQELPDVKPLDTLSITMFGLQIYSGVYLSIKQ